MAKIAIDLPATFSFVTSIPIRITDINYGGHAGNDAILSLVHEARMQYLKKFGYAELEFEGIGLIMSDAGIEFKGELFYGDIVIASVVTGEFTKIGFDIFYKLEKEINGERKLVAAVKTGMVGYDYSRKKITALPPAAVDKLKS
ncbi:MAG: thioesterase family protein [Chitinophagaceae bacterium]